MPVGKARFAERRLGNIDSHVLRLARRRNPTESRPNGDTGAAKRDAVGAFGQQLHTKRGNRDGAQPRKRDADHGVAIAYGSRCGDHHGTVLTHPQRRGIGLRHRRRSDPSVGISGSECAHPTAPRLESRSRSRLAFNPRHPVSQPRGLATKVRTVHLDLGRKRMIVAPALEIRIRCVVVVIVHAPLLHIGEEGLHGVEVARRERIVLVVMALAAAHGRTQPGHSDGANPVRGVLGQVLFRLRPALAGDHIQSVEGGRDAGFRPCAGNQIAGELFARELVEALVLVEGVNDVFAIRKDVDVLVAVISDRVGVTHHVEPRHRHPLAMMRRTEQPFDLTFIRVLRPVAQKRIDLTWSGRKACEVQTEPAQQRCAIRLRRTPEPLSGQLGIDEGIDRPRAARAGNCRPHGRHIGPVRLIHRALDDPTLDPGPLLRRDLLVGLGRRHEVVRIGGSETPYQFTFRRFPWDDSHLAGLPGSHCFVGKVEPQIRLPRVLVRAVAEEAIFRKNRPNIAIILNAVPGRRRSDPAHQGAANNGGYGGQQQSRVASPRAEEDERKRHGTWPRLIRRRCRSSRGTRGVCASRGRFAKSDPEPFFVRIYDGAKSGIVPSVQTTLA